LSLAQKEEIAWQRGKAERKAFDEEQRAMSLGWAKWWCLRGVATDVANKYRAEHTDESGDKNWMIQFVSLREVDGVRIPRRLSKRRDTNHGTKPAQN
jgi:hypothetical protein